VITAANEDEVEIRLVEAELNRLPAFQEHLDAGEMAEVPSREAGRASAGDTRGASALDAVGLHADHSVHGTDGPAGRLERLLVDLPALNITDIVIRKRRPFGHSVIDVGEHTVSWRESVKTSMKYTNLRRATAS
jgi:hypothetical protein